MSVRCHIVVTLKNKRCFCEHAVVPVIECDSLDSTHSVDHRLWPHFDVHHSSSQDMACVVRLDLQLIIHLPGPAHKQLDSPSRDEQLAWNKHTTGCAETCASERVKTTTSARHLDGLVEVQRNHFLHAVLNHLRSEEVGFSLLVNSDLPEVFQ